MLCVHPSSPFKTAQELVALAKANPGKLTFASAGIGTGIHLAGEQFRQVAGIDIVIVPYRGGAPSLTDFLVRQGGFHLRRRPDDPRAYPGRQGARARRHARHARRNCPTFRAWRRSATASVDSASEMGLIVPAATPAPIVEKLQQHFRECGEERGVPVQSLLERGFQPIGSTTEEFRAHVDREIEKWIGSSRRATLSRSNSVTAALDVASAALPPCG